MAKRILIENARLFLQTDTIENGYLLIEDGKIVTISKEQIDITKNVYRIDGTGKNVLPGFIDMHIHGTKGADVMDATETALDTIATALPKSGTTSFLATTMTASISEIDEALENIANYKQKNKTATLLGIHLEGPFIHRNKSGAQQADNIIPGNIALFKRWQQVATGKIKLVTLAPECAEDGFINYLTRSGVIASAGHTTATFAEIKRATQEGIRHLTHLGNAMTGLHHRDVGVVGAGFLLDALQVEIIADYIHLAPEMLEIIVKQIGAERIILITDAMRATSLGNGTYEFGGQEVTVRDTRATLANGVLAGSVITMIESVRNMLQIPGITLRDIIKITAENPAKQLHIFNDKGSIAIGKTADLVIVDERMEITHTICQGEIAYEE